MQRTIDAPDKEWLTLPEMAKWLGIGAKTVRRMLSDGEIPPGVPMGRGRAMWSWRDAVAISIQLGWKARVKPASPPVTPR